MGLQPTGTGEDAPIFVFSEVRACPYAGQQAQNKTELQN